MSNQKKTIEELIKVVRSTDDKLVRQDEFTDFRNETGLYDSGAPWTSASLLYYVYVEWKKDIGEEDKLLSPRKFGVLAKKFFKSKRSNQGIQYKVTCEKIEGLSNGEKEEAIQKIKATYQD